jgi:hypothetical protein
VILKGDTKVSTVFSAFAHSFPGEGAEGGKYLGEKNVITEKQP